jgi:alginate O-acetyltransferase complex protein AlgJ
MATIKFYGNIVLILLFIVTLICPILLQISGYKINAITSENRSKATMPEFKINSFTGLEKDLDAFIKMFQNYYNDNFTFRDLLIHLYRNIKLDLLKTDPFPEKVVIGREKWMFLGESHSLAISVTKGLINFSEKELEEITNNIQESINFFDNLDIHFYLAIAPEKSTVYGDYIPVLKSKKPTKLDQVKKRLLRVGCKIIDMKDDFNQIQNHLLFYKTDSHWNEFGEFLGYQTLMKRLKSNYPNLDVLQQADFQIDSINDYQGDNARLLFLPWAEKKYIFTTLNEQDVFESEKIYSVPTSYLWDPANYERRFGNNKKKLKVLIFHDSFFREFPKFIAPSFKETVFIWSEWNKKIILDEKPDLVIFEIVERGIDALLNPLN